MEENQTIFQANEGHLLLAAGYIRHDAGSDVILVRFFLGNEQVGAPIYVFRGSSVAFSYTTFDRIMVNCVGVNDGGIDACNGQLSLVTRFPH